MKTIIHRLRKTGRLEQAWDLYRAAGVCTVIWTASLIAILGIEAIAHASIGVRTVLWWLWVGGSGIGTWSVLLLPLARYLGLLPMASAESIALRVGDAYPDIRDTLSNALQLQAGSTGSVELVSAAVQSASNAADGKDFTVIINRKPARRAWLLALTSGALLAVLLFTLPGIFGASLVRLLNYNKSYLPPAPFSLTISQDADTVLRGSDAQIFIEAKGVVPKDATLYIREAGSKQFVPIAVSFDTSMSVVHRFPGITATVQAYAFAPWNDTGVTTDTATIVVIDRPLIRSLTGKVVPPAYTQQPPAEISDQRADITALAGSVVHLTVVSNKKLRKAVVNVGTRHDSVRTDTTGFPMTISGNIATVRFAVRSGGWYSIQLLDSDGQQNATPVQHTITVLSDGYPTITMVQPTKDVDVDASARLPMLMAIADDYGFSSLRLKYRLVKSRYAMPEKDFRSINLPLQPKVTALDVGYTWDLTKLDITPDDVFEFYVEVADNDVVTGPKTAKTGTYTVRMPSLDKIFADTDKEHESISKDLTKLAKETEQMQRESEELRRELQKQQSQSQTQTQWSDRKKAEDLVARRQELQKKMETLADRIEQMSNKLQQHKAISPETLEKYKELQELMRHVKSEELERMQKRMQDAMKQLSPEELEKAMQNFTFDEEKFRQSIERTLNLLKRIQAEQKADELAKRAEELAQRQNDLAKQTQNTNPMDKEARSKLADQQQKLREDTEKLARDAEDLQKMMKDLGVTMPQDKMDAAMEELDAQQTTSDMNDATEQLSHADMQKAAQKQNSASKNLQRFAQQMQQVKKQMNKNAQREAMRQMQRGIQDAVELSKQQEELMKQMQGVDPSSQQFTQLAQRQKQIQEAMMNMANSMMQLSQRSTSVTPEMAQDMGDALQNMQNALQQMQDRMGSMAQRSQQGAMQSMNSAAKRMSDALGQMMSGDAGGQGGQGQSPGMGQGSGESPFQRLQKLADMQQQINNQMPGQGGQQPGGQQQGQGGQGSQGGQGGQGGQLSPQQQAELGRLAAQQGRALKAIQELEQERRNIAGTRKPIGDLQQIADDMKEVMTDMQTGSVTPETRLRQERILSRLLNASRSMNERDLEKTRESNSGVDVMRTSPAELNIKLNDPSAMKQLLDQMRKRYSRDYENLIRSYFEALRNHSIPVNTD